MLSLQALDAHPHCTEQLRWRLLHSFQPIDTFCELQGLPCRTYSCFDLITLEAARLIAQQGQRGMAQPATAAESRKVRLKRRALQLVLAARPALVWALLGLGVAAFLLLPLAAKNISADEKAILFGGREPAARCELWQAALLPRPAALHRQHCW